MRQSDFVQLRDSIFATLASAFPVTSTSDEFPEFPQVVSAEKHWENWDDFSARQIERLARKMARWEKKLSGNVLAADDPNAQPSKNLKDNLDQLTNRIDRTQLVTLLGNLREHLTLVRRWERQPTFYLTIAAVGMAEALDSGDPAAPHARAKGLIDFFDQSSRNLKKIPALFNRLGIEMVADVRHFFQTLVPTIPDLKQALTALDRFRSLLTSHKTVNRFQLPPGLFERLIRNHLGTGMTVTQVNASLDSEIEIYQRKLNWLLNRYFPGRSMERAYRQIPLPRIGKGGLLGLYRAQVNDLAHFFIKNQIVSSKKVDHCPVMVKPVPDFLSATRSASSYSIPPGHPPSGGTFYVINANETAEAMQDYQREYRILTAHETYPGHHLLDACRWRLTNPIRQVIERPLFYEGWACFAEELMFRLGYFSDPTDHFMLVRRQFWRALRGKVDLGLQTKTMTLETAARTLKQAGLPIHRAKKIVRKYALNPGYQVCYTIGYQKFRQLFNLYGRGQIPRFIQTVTSQGEIHFEDLAAVLKKVLKKQPTIDDR